MAERCFDHSVYGTALSFGTVQLGTKICPYPLVISFLLTLNLVMFETLFSIRK